MIRSAARSMPKIGDVLLRGDGTTGFELVRAGSLERIQAGIPSLEAAIEIARIQGAGAIWQQSFDNRGRALGDPVRLCQFTSRRD
jgi:hypothetical protein